MDDIKALMAWGMLLVTETAQFLVGAVILAFAIIALWKLFQKAGQKGWKILIPGYNIYTMYKIAWNVSMFWMIIIASVSGLVLVCLFPNMLGSILLILCYLAVLIIDIIFHVKLAAAYGKSGGFAVGLIFLPLIFIMILGLGKAKYIGPQI